MNKKRFFSNDGDLFLFRDGALMIVAAVVSLLLQTISFFTTLDGAKAYFEATFALAPLLFALAVQSVVYFLENGIRRKVTFGKVVALSLAITCSSYFSFVGIYNNINPPSSYLERTYNSYVKSLEEIADSIEFSTTGNAQNAVNTAVNGILREHSAISAELSTLDSLAEQIADARAEDSYSMTPPRRSDYEEYEDYAAAYSAYIASLSQSNTAEQAAKVQALLAKYGMSDPSDITVRSSELTARLSLIEGTVGASGDAFSSSAELLRKRIMQGDSTLAQSIFSLYSDISGDKLDVPEGLFAQELTLELPDYSEISENSPAAVVRERLSAVVSEAVDVVNSAGAGISINDYTFQNIYTLPLYCVVSGEYGMDSLVSLILAVLVDVLSLLFAMIFVKQQSILTAVDTRKAADMRGSLFEQNVLTALQIGLCAEGDSFSGEWSGDRLTERLADFVGKFSAADFAADKGYSLIAVKSMVSEYEALVAFLCQFGLAKTLSAEDSELLTSGEMSVPCVLLKTKFLLWVSEKYCTSDRITEDKKEVVSA